MAGRVGGKQRVPGLELQQLVLGTVRPPPAVKIAEEPAVLLVDRVREPGVDDMTSEGALQFIDQNHGQLSPPRPPCGSLRAGQLPASNACNTVVGRPVG